MGPEHWRFTLSLRLRSLFRWAQADRELDDELRDHLERKTEEYVAQGMTQEEAHRRARIDLDGIEQTKEKCRDARRVNWIQDFAQDLRFGLRMLRKSPGFTSVAVITLAVGIGANTAVFSAIDAILLQPLPYVHPEQLMLVSESVPAMGGGDDNGVAAGEYLDYRDRNHCFAKTAAYQNDGFNLTGAGAPLRVNASRATTSLFSLLGVRPTLGRTFTDEESQPGGDNVVVISYGLWQRQYGGDFRVIGQSIKLDERPYSIIGVMPESFRFPSDSTPANERVELWVPLSFTPDQIQDRLREFGTYFIGRLKTGVTEAQAQQDIEAVADGFMQEHRDLYSGTIRVVPHTFSYSAHHLSKVRPLLLLLMAAVACVLLIACANVANLLLARASHRTREMAIRAAIGAARQRLLAQCLIESLLLALLGGITGVLLAWVLILELRHFGPASLARLRDIALHPAALGFTLLVSVITSIFFGLVPALRLSQVSPHAGMKESAQAGPSRATHTLQKRVAIGEIAIALVLLIGGGLLLKSFVNVLNVPFGFDPNGAVIVRTLFDQPRYPDPLKREAVQKELLDRLSHLPGVSTVAAASHLPLSDDRQIGFRLESAPSNEFHWAENSLVTPEYFRAMGMSVVRGRDISYGDTRNTQPVAVVNQTFARKFLEGKDPLDVRFNWGDRALFSIVGLVNDVHISALDADPPPMIYLSMFQVESGASVRTAFIMRLTRPTEKVPQGIFTAVQQEIWAVDKGLPTYDTTTLAALVSESVAQRRCTTLLMSGFALVALMLASIGLFGVISYGVSERTRELAVRMALGADRASIYWTVLRSGAIMALFGCVAGLGAFSLGSRLLRSALYEVSVFDPFTVTLASLLLIGFALLACYWPARRAVRVDPMVALRYE
jgi:putative ABC transport system permease protein